MTEAYPLQWPQGKPRTLNAYRSKFGTRTLEQCRKILEHEIKLLGGVHVVISTNLKLRNDGYPYSGQRQPEDKGASIYFKYKDRQMCFACDRWDRIEDNIYAVAMTVEALRGIERWGSGSMVEQAFTGFVALPPKPSAYIILGVRENASLDEINSAYRQKAKSAHTDVGGMPGEMQRLNEARDEIMKSRRA